MTSPVLRSNMPKSVAFSGYYGMSNFGDDLFGLTCSWGARTYWNMPANTIVGPELDRVNAEFSVPSWYPLKVWQAPGGSGKASRLLFNLGAAMKNDVLILGGGSTLSGGGFGTRDILGLLATMGKIRLAGLGVSVGPFSSTAAEKRIVDFLKKFEFLSVRDRNSFEIVSQMNLSGRIQMAGDLAGIMPHIVKRPVSQVKSKRRRIGVSLCNYERYVGGNLSIESARNAAMLSGIVQAASSHDAEVLIFVLNTHELLGDRELGEKMRQTLTSAGISSSIITNLDASVVSIWQSIADCDVMFSVRLHGAFAAYLNEVPFCLVEYHQKCSDFLDDIGQPVDLRIRGDECSHLKVSSVIDTLFIGKRTPAVAFEKYTEMSTKHFVNAPWATGNENSAA